MRKEWLALILELDATAGQSGPTFKTPSNGDYPWFNQKGEDGYKKALLERRSGICDIIFGIVSHDIRPFLTRSTTRVVQPADRVL